ncbi:hypothetical protein HELRODRAFT_183203 [Helobdella robusta]|uniref:Uncharacterized protein n=1 Tax=Helobdella robusta TaxID=6412 RepID=T1FJA8_HELRO|nr:hypothetical protein HELRODRAFT_183203 [Helobdella robusta]ESO11417.1 hypothetical protein HELRODRAFT_183203 [Helobdella robusta]
MTNINIIDKEEDTSEEEETENGRDVKNYLVVHSFLRKIKNKTRTAINFVIRAHEQEFSTTDATDNSTKVHKTVKPNIPTHDSNNTLLNEDANADITGKNRQNIFNDDKEIFKNQTCYKNKSVANESKGDINDQNNCVNFDKLTEDGDCLESIDRDKIELLTLTENGQNDEKDDDTDIKDNNTPTDKNATVKLNNLSQQFNHPHKPSNLYPANTNDDGAASSERGDSESSEINFREDDDITDDVIEYDNHKKNKNGNKTNKNNIIESESADDISFSSLIDESGDVRDDVDIYGVDGQIMMMATLKNQHIHT